MTPTCAITHARNLGRLLWGGDGQGREGVTQGVGWGIPLCMACMHGMPSEFPGSPGKAVGETWGVVKRVDSTQTAWA